MDSFSAEQAEWIATIPGEVDVEAEGVRQRVGRIARQFDRILADVAAQHGVSIGDLEALSVLARAAKPEKGTTAGQLGTILGLTSGTVSVRIERLVQAQLVTTVGNRDARRKSLTLTRHGRALWSSATLDRIAREERLIKDHLDHSQVVELNALLSSLLAALENAYGPAPRHDMTRLRSSHKVRVPTMSRQRPHE